MAKRKGEPDTIEYVRSSDGSKHTISGTADGNGGIDRSLPHSHVVQKNGKIVSLRDESGRFYVKTDE